MTQPRFLLTPTLRVLDLPTQRPETAAHYCERCAGKFTKEAFAAHDSSSCLPIDELIANVVQANKPVACPQGCGLIHPRDLTLHRTLGCKGAAAAGFGPFATGSELSLAD